MTSSKQLLETSRQIGWPQVEKVDPHAVDWAFEKVATQPFMHWFSNNVSVDNVITSQELLEFQQLEAKGCVLEGSQLNETLASIPTDSVTEGLDVDHLRSDIEELKQSLEKVKARKSMLMKRNNNLSVHHMAVKNKLTKMREVKEQWLKMNRQSVERCGAVNAKIDESLQKLVGSVGALIELYNCPSKTSKESRTGVEASCDFLSQAELKAFHDAEEKFSRDLTAFTKKQFFSGLAELAGERETAEYSLLDVSSPQNVALSGDEKDTFLDDCREFTRIQEIFPVSETARINALVNSQRALCAVREAGSILRLLKSDQFPLSPKEISQRKRDAEQNMAAVQTESAPLLSSVLGLVVELGGLQGTDVLTGDYDLKLRRQDYFMKNQDKVIDQLVSQRARNEFLSLLYEMEVRWHKETHRLLTAARQTLQGQMSTWQQRMNELDDPDFSVKKFESNVVDTRDTSTARLYQMLDVTEDEEKPLYLQTQKVVAKGRKLQSELDGVQLADRTADEKCLAKVGQLESCVGECEAVLYSGSSTSRGLPALSLLDVQVSMVSLMSSVNALEKCIMEVVNDINAKKTALKNNVLLSKERELFSLFHTNPSRLQYVVNGLNDRVKAQQIQES
ncbi:HAUS augmin-like complex subunit 3 [Aplysia californica]|uniref:HAUS augmin-like complex subunit 3 n=1 Tax=Aplysia californica TaxID=6500 RepID=A0ABM0K7B0_APLCA|nr:HAUS augmin-like complex subunit 3 [Aplysia californica]XP_005110444.1 HAUS augmin-like complex subunit 3 [Aplysia californica]